LPLLAAIAVGAVAATTIPRLFSLISDLRHEIRDLRGQVVAERMQMLGGKNGKANGDAAAEAPAAAADGDNIPF
jgi:hypothetical protein